MKIPTKEEIARRLERKRQKKEAAQGEGGGFTYIDEEEINSLHSLNQLAELESVREGTRRLVGEIAKAEAGLRKVCGGMKG